MRDDSRRAPARSRTRAVAVTPRVEPGGQRSDRSSASGQRSLQRVGDGLTASSATSQTRSGDRPRWRRRCESRPDRATGEAVSNDAASMRVSEERVGCARRPRRRRPARARRTGGGAPGSRALTGSGIGSPANAGTPRASLAARYRGGSDSRGSRPCSTVSARSTTRPMSCRCSATAGSSSGRRAEGRPTERSPPQAVMPGRAPGERT